MRIILGFLLGIFLGVGSTYYYISKQKAREEVLSVQTILPTDTEALAQAQGETSTPTLTEILASITPSPVYSITTPEISPIPLTPTPSPKPTSVPTPTNFPGISPTPSISPTPTLPPIPNYSQEEIHGFIDRFSGQYAVDPNVLRYITSCESGFNPLAVNGPYAGLYQFSANTWKTYRLLIGEDAASELRFNAEEAVQTAAYVLAIGKSSIWPNCVP